MSNLKQTFTTILILATIFLINNFLFAWTAPTEAPPSGNVPAPINTSATEQYKSGAFGVGGVLKGYSDLELDGVFRLKEQISNYAPVAAEGYAKLYFKEGETDTEPNYGTWTRRTVSAGTYGQYPTEIIYDGTNYVISGSKNESADGYLRRTAVWESTNLSTWTERSVYYASTYQQDGRLYYDSVNRKYIFPAAAGTVGSQPYTWDPVVWVSTDRSSWPLYNMMPGGDTTHDVAVSVIYNSYHSKYVATGFRNNAGSSSYDTDVWESTNLSTWTERVVDARNSDQKGTSIVYNPTTAKYVVGGYELIEGTSNYDAVVWESTNLSTWTRRTVDGGVDNQSLTHLIYDSVNGKYIAAGSDYNGGADNDAVIWESTDLTSWTQRNVETGSGSQNINRIIYDSDNSKYLAVGGNSENGGDPVVWVSSDLISWTKWKVDNSAGNQSALSIIYDSNNDKYVVVGAVYSGTKYDMVIWEAPNPFTPSGASSGLFLKDSSGIEYRVMLQEE